MALKDWKKVKSIKNSYQWINKQLDAKILVGKVYDNWYFEHISSSGSVYDEIFETKSEALKEAKEYMREN